MTRKSFLQTALLVVLVLAGAGLYLARQEGGFAFIMALLGREAPAPAKPAPPPRRGSGKPDAPEAPAGRPARAAASKPAVPSQPAQGEIGGVPFVVHAAAIESGVLTLRQEERPLAVQIVLPANPWQVPAGRSFEVLAPRERTPDTPLVRVHEGGSGREARAREFADEYTLWLEFGREQDRRLPGKIHLALPDEDGSRVVGTFTAEVRGFRFIDGKPDLAADSVETFEYLALREILADDPDKALDQLAFHAGRLVPAAAGDSPSGFLEVGYRAQAGRVRQTFRFVKEDGRWRVAEIAPGTRSERDQREKTR